jgi:polygalacturonase
LGCESRRQTISHPGTKEFLVKAKSDTIKLATKAIQAAIDACAKQGGGIVVFSPVFMFRVLFLLNQMFSCE